MSKCWTHKLNHIYYCRGNDDAGAGEADLAGDSQAVNAGEEAIWANLNSGREAEKLMKQVSELQLICPCVSSLAYHTLKTTHGPAVQQKYKKYNKNNKYKK